MKHWRIDDVAWQGFAAERLDPAVVPLVKAAAMVERNGTDYAVYLNNVFRDDPEFARAADAWSVEEVQHGDALGRWAMLAEPGWDYLAAFARFREGYRIPLQAETSVRGSRTGELIARCMVETGTSSYYSALSEATTEPVLKSICQHIAADEHRHYKLFYTHLKKYLELDGISTFQRLRIALGRIVETEDDELACAFYCANTSDDEPYVRERYSREYMSRAYNYYQHHHLDRAVGMIFKACGLSPQTPLFKVSQRVAWWIFENRARQLQKAAA
jgi:rubrerythrin